MYMCAKVKKKSGDGPWLLWTVVVADGAIHKG